MTPDDRFLDCLARMESEGKHRECCWVVPEPADEALSAWVARVGDKESDELRYSCT